MCVCVCVCGGMLARHDCTDVCISSICEMANSSKGLAASAADPVFWCKKLGKNRGNIKNTQNGNMEAWKHEKMKLRKTEQ